MCRNDNEIYCTEGQFSHSEPFSPFGQKGQKNENGISGGHVFFHRCNHSFPTAGRQNLVVPGTEIGVGKPVAECGKGFPF